MYFKPGHTALPLLFIVALPMGCIESYTLEGGGGDQHFLVVDGFIDATNKVCTVKLSRSTSLNDDNAPEGETGAVVFITSEDGSGFQVNEVVPDSPKDETGVYTADGIPVNVGEVYQLHVTLSDGSQYESDPVRIEQAGQIESLDWSAESDGLKVRVSTVPNTNSTNFYRWRFAETFEYRAPLTSSFVMSDGWPRLRKADERITTCYRRDPAYNILIGSSQDLSVNVIRNYIVQALPRTTLKLSMRYHLHLWQYALTEDAYTYWLNLYKTTESTGGLFDPMPGQVIGNIKSVTDPSEVVVGYFSGSTVEEKTIWIGRSELPLGYLQYSQGYCPIDTLDADQVQHLLEGAPLIDQYLGRYLVSSPTCLDCRIFGGGTTTKPGFWP